MISEPRKSITAEELEAVDSAALAAALVHITGEFAWVEEPFRSMHAARHDPARPQQDAVHREFVAQAHRRLQQWDGRTLRLASPPEETLRRMVIALTEDGLSPSYVAKARDELDALNRTSASKRIAGASSKHVLVIGAGMSGINVALAVRDAGFQVTVIDKSADVGGVWHANTYPECGVDSHPFVYAWSRFFNTAWTRFDAKRDEIQAYITRCVAASGMREQIRFGVEVQRAVWNEAESQWAIQASGPSGAQEFRADILISAVGALNRPKIPRIENLERFAGKSFHTAEWPAGIDLRGKRVGLVGNGSSGTQVGRWIAQKAKSLTAFQRSPHWIAPRSPLDSGAVPEAHRRLLEEMPLYAAWYRFLLFWWRGDREFPTLVRDPSWRGPGPNARSNDLRDLLAAYIRQEVGDRPDLVAKLIPQYPPFSKRMVVDNGWYRTLGEPHVRLVTEPLSHARNTGLVTAGGEHHELDVLVFATGFHGTRFFWPMEVRGRDAALLADPQQPDDARAYLGVVVPGFPNFFALQGPNSTVGHGGAATFISECQTRYIMACLELMGGKGGVTIECRRDVFEAYNRELDAGLARMVWSTPGVRSRYRNDSGRIVMNHPWSMLRFWELTRAASATDFIVSTDVAAKA